MGFTPAFDTLDTPVTLVGGHTDILRARASQTTLRFGGLVFEPRTGATSWRGKMLALAVEDREVLAVLMRRAGQIVSRQALASLLNVSADRLDRRMLALRESLKAAGATCLPVRVDGLGYVLWRC